MSNQELKNKIANNINCVDNISRTIVSDRKLDLKVGDIYNNMGKAESWSGSNCSSSFIPENTDKYVYVFFCKNVSCHAVDYENEEECEILGAIDCESEGEVLIPASTIMRITFVATDDDFEEMGYYEINLELVNEEA